jgi:hypothetical protein
VLRAGSKRRATCEERGEVVILSAETSYTL